MPKLTKYQRDAIDALRAFLDVNHPAFKGSEEIRKALGRDGAGLYIGSWVLPLLDVIESGYTSSAQQWNTQSDANRARLALREKKDAELLAKGFISRTEPVNVEHEEAFENSLERPLDGRLSNLRTDEPDTSMAGDEEAIYSGQDPMADRPGDED